MSKSHRITVFGKQGCDKCRILNQRLDKLLAAEEWKDFEKHYCDVETEDGLVGFCEAECINPQRIPALLVTRANPATGEFEPIPSASPGAKDPICKSSRLYQFLGLQTDYSQTGDGTITPKMITTVLSEARS